MEQEYWHSCRSIVRCRGRRREQARRRAARRTRERRIEFHRADEREKAVRNSWRRYVHPLCTRHGRRRNRGTTRWDDRLPWCRPNKWIHRELPERARCCVGWFESCTTRRFAAMKQTETELKGARN